MKKGCVCSMERREDRDRHLWECTRRQQRNEETTDMCAREREDRGLDSTTQKKQHDKSIREMEQQQYHNISKQGTTHTRTEASSSAHSIVSPRYTTTPHRHATISPFSSSSSMEPIHRAAYLGD